MLKIEENESHWDTNLHWVNNVELLQRKKKMHFQQNTENQEMDFPGFTKAQKM